MLREVLWTLGLILVFAAAITGMALFIEMPHWLRVVLSIGAGIVASELGKRLAARA